jgi:DNA-binding protein HU-beta
MTETEEAEKTPKKTRAKITPVTEEAEKTPKKTRAKAKKKKRKKSPAQVAKAAAVKARARARAKAKAKALADALAKAQAKAQAKAKVQARPPVKSPDLNKIRRIHIVDIISKTTSNSKEDSATLFDATLEVIAQALKQGTVVGLPGIGTLTVKATATRPGVNPNTSEKIQLPAHKRVTYKIAKDLKAAL